MSNIRADWERQKFRQLKKRLKAQWRRPQGSAPTSEAADAAMDAAEPIYAREAANDQER